MPNLKTFLVISVSIFFSANLFGHDVFSLGTITKDHGSYAFSVVEDI